MGASPVPSRKARCRNIPSGYVARFIAAPASGENGGLACLHAIDRPDLLRPAGTGALRLEELGGGTV
jgi:hypothetical protein